jgi:hypothetical protein
MLQRNIRLLTFNQLIFLRYKMWRCVYVKIIWTWLMFILMFTMVLRGVYGDLIVGNTKTSPDWKFFSDNQNTKRPVEGIQNKKFTSRKLIVIHISGLCQRKRKLWTFLFSCPAYVRSQLMTFAELSNDVDTTGASSMRVMSSRVAILDALKM